MIEARHEFFLHDGVVGSFTNVLWSFKVENPGNNLSMHMELH